MSDTDRLAKAKAANRRHGERLAKPSETAPGDSDTPPVVLRRTGTVSAVNAGSLDVTVGGVSWPAVPVAYSGLLYTVGDVVVVDIVNRSPMVVDRISSSLTATTVFAGPVEARGPLRTVAPGATSSSRVYFKATDAAADAKVADMIAYNTGTFYMRFLNDAENAAHNWLYVTRSGYQPTTAVFDPALKVYMGPDTGAYNGGQYFQAVTDGSLTAAKFISKNGALSGDGNHQLALRHTGYPNADTLIGQNSSGQLDFSWEFGSGPLIAQRFYSGGAIYAGGSDYRFGTYTFAGGATSTDLWLNTPTGDANIYITAEAGASYPDVSFNYRTKGAGVHRFYDSAGAGFYGQIGASGLYGLASHSYFGRGSVVSGGYLDVYADTGTSDVWLYSRGTVSGGYTNFMHRGYRHYWYDIGGTEMMHLGQNAAGASDLTTGTTSLWLLWQDNADVQHNSQVKTGYDGATGRYYLWVN